MNGRPIWSKDGKWIVYTQQQAKGTDSNVFIAEVATGKSTLLTPHDGEHLYTADDISPDGKKVLITSNADNGYDNVGLTRYRRARKSTGSPRTSGKSRAAGFLLTASTSPGPPTSTAIPTSMSTIWSRERPLPCRCPKA